MFESFTGGAGKEEFEDFEEDLIEQKFLGGESKKDFAARQVLRAKYVAQCNKGKAEFGKEIKQSVASLKTLGTNNSRATKQMLGEINGDLATVAANYKTSVMKIVKNGEGNPTIPAGDVAALKASHAKAFADINSSMKKIAEAKKKTYQNKAMLLQTGQ